MKPQRRKTDQQIWFEVLSAHGVHREKKVANALTHFSDLLKRHQRRMLYITVAWLPGLLWVLLPISSHAIYERRPWAISLLGVYLILHVLWIVQVGITAKAWIRFSKFKEFAASDRP